MVAGPRADDARRIPRRRAENSESAPAGRNGSSARGIDAAPRHLDRRRRRRVVIDFPRAASAAETLRRARGHAAGNARPRTANSRARGRGQAPMKKTS